MIFTVDSEGGLFRIGRLSIYWQNPGQFPAFTSISWKETSIELGDIDNGNGIFLTRYANGDIEFTTALLRL